MIDVYLYNNIHLADLKNGWSFTLIFLQIYEAYVELLNNFISDVLVYLMFSLFVQRVSSYMWEQSTIFFLQLPKENVCLM